MGDDKCNCGKFGLWIIILLLINTFFIGSIWCKMVMQCKTSKCSWSKSGSKICPLTGKNLDGAKGSAMDAKGSKAE